MRILPPQMNGSKVWWVRCCVWPAATVCHCDTTGCAGLLLGPLRHATAAEQHQRAPEPAICAGTQMSSSTLYRCMGSVSNSEVGLRQVAATLLGKTLKEAALDPYVMQRLLADVESHLNGLRNAAFASGYVAGKGELVAYAQGTYL
jgi:hypothetical protein